MKIISTKSILLVVAFAMIFTSCRVSQTTKNIKKLDIEFDSLKRSDFKIVKNMTAESSVEFTNLGKLKDQYILNFKDGNVGAFPGNEAREITVRTVKWNPDLKRFDYVTYTFIRPDYASQFAAYALIEKYPDIDYFTNVRAERILTGRKFLIWNIGGTKETIKIKADGIELRTDKK